MKKLIISTLILLALAASLIGCESDNDSTDISMSAGFNSARVQSTYFDSEIVEEGDAYYILRDSNTDVLYLVVRGHYSATMTPIYNADGSVRTYADFCSQGG